MTPDEARQAAHAILDGRGHWRNARREDLSERVNRLCDWVLRQTEGADELPQPEPPPKPVCPSCFGNGWVSFTDGIQGYGSGPCRCAGGSVWRMHA